MKKPTSHVLAEKGWQEEEIKKVERTLKHSAKRDAHLTKIVFWSALLVIIVANLVVSLVLVPFLIVLNRGVLYAVIIILALTIGFLYNFLITDIGHLKKKHHRIASVLVPLIGLANVVVMVLLSNRILADTKIPNAAHNPWTAAVIFAVAFILPYIIDQIRIHLYKKARLKPV